MASLGLLQLISSVTVWSWPQPKLFLLYICMALVCSFLQLRISGALSPPLSANVPVILLSILQLSLPEAVIVGASAALVQGFLNRRTRSLRLHFVLGIGVAASAIATADFIYRSLIPNSVQSPTLRLLAASLTLFFANTFPVALASRGHQQARLGPYWKESYSWLVPYYLVSAAVASVANAAATGGVSLQTILLVLPAVYLAYRYYRVQKSNLEMRAKTAENMAALHLRTIEGLALAVEAKDSLNTRGHLRRVRVYALGVGQDLGLEGDELEALQAGALLHDIGKLAVPEYILTKPGKLTPQEFAKMKVHPIVGAEIVEQVQFPYPVAPIVRAHHEKWDGSGYPFGLKGQDIPIGARILSAVDYLDALASDREYRRALPLDEAMKLVEAESGKGLDPEVVKALGRRYRELEQSARATDEGGVTLSKNVTVERGSAPDAGLDLWALAGVPSGGDFVDTIAAAGKEQQMLLALTQGLGSSLDLDTILEHVEDGLRPFIACQAMAIYVPQGDTLVMTYSAGEHKAMLSSEVRAGEGLVGWVAQNQQPIVNGNPTVERGFRGDVENGLKAALAVPLKRSSGLAGVLAYYRRDRDAFDADHLRILTSVAPRIGTAIENALKVRELHERANMDLITGLPTLRAMLQVFDVELIRAKRQNQSLAVIVAQFSGLSSLKPDTSNSDVECGLREAAQLLKTVCREYDHVARIGGDTFAMILPGMKRENLGDKIEKVHSAVLSIFPQLIENGTIRFGVGWARYPDDADTSKALLAIAEGRNEMRMGSSTENLLAMHAHNREETDSPATKETQLGFEQSGAVRP
jgi:diguanylate cyclase (GGDEF)-like protein/putative nucleotidyltransferase with HDIG domain